MELWYKNETMYSVSILYLHCTCIKNYINENEPSINLCDFMPNTHENELLL